MAERRDRSQNLWDIHIVGTEKSCSSSPALDVTSIKRLVNTTNPQLSSLCDRYKGIQSAQVPQFSDWRPSACECIYTSSYSDLHQVIKPTKIQPWSKRDKITLIITKTVCKALSASRGNRGKRCIRRSRRRRRSHGSCRNGRFAKRRVPALSWRRIATSYSSHQ